MDTEVKEKEESYKIPQRVVLDCACSSDNHVMIGTFDEDNNEIYISIHLYNPIWYKRIWHAIKYIFGFKCVYGDFDEIIINKTNKYQFIELFNKIDETKQY